MEARDLFRRKFLGEGHGRQPRAVQNLVGVGVADAAHDRGVAQAAFEGARFAAQGRAEGLLVDLERLDAAARERR